MARKRLRFPYRYDSKIRAKANRLEKIVIPYIILNGYAVPIAFTLALLYSGAAAKLSRFILPAAQWPIAAAIFGVVLAVLLSAATFPAAFAMYFVKRRFGLLRQKVLGWLGDYLKGFMLSAIFAVIAVLGVQYFIITSPALWWLYAGLAFLGFTFVMEYLFPKIVTPLFYKTAPYKDKRQRARLLQMVRRASAKEIKEVLVAKESRRSKIANAFFTGFGNTKQMVLYDNLINNLTPDEVETVVAHELGHYVNKDIWRGALVSFTPVIPIFYIADLALKSFAPKFGIVIGDLAGVVVIYLMFLLAGIFTTPFILAYSRRVEAQADIFALNIVRKPLAQASAERRLTDIDLGDERPPRIIEILFWTHPAPERRVKMCVEWASKRGAKLRL